MTTNLGYLPSEIIAGAALWVADENPLNTFSDISINDFLPADGILTYRFAAPTPISVIADANGADDGWTLYVEGSKTLLWAAGQIQYDAIMVADGITYAVDSGAMSVSASPTTVSQWVAIRTSAVAALAAYATNPHSSFMVDGIQISYRKPKDLTDIIEYCDGMIAKDTGRRQTRKIRSHFTIQR